jgi:hypothetical protein
MALTRTRTERPQAAGHVSHDAQVRIDRRIERIPARGESGPPAAQASATRPKEAGDAVTRRKG